MSETKSRLHSKAVWYRRAERLEQFALRHEDMPSHEPEITDYWLAVSLTAHHRVTPEESSPGHHLWSSVLTLSGLAKQMYHEKVKREFESLNPDMLILDEDIPAIAEIFAN